MSLKGPFLGMLHLRGVRKPLRGLCGGGSVRMRGSEDKSTHPTPAVLLSLEGLLSTGGYPSSVFWKGWCSCLEPHSTVLLFQTRETWRRDLICCTLSFSVSTSSLLPPDSTSMLAGPSPRAVQPPECRVQPLPALAQLPMSTLLDPK